MEDIRYQLSWGMLWSSFCIMIFVITQQSFLYFLNLIENKGEVISLEGSFILGWITVILIAGSNIIIFHLKKRKDN